MSVECLVNEAQLHTLPGLRTSHRTSASVPLSPTGHHTCTPVATGSALTFKLRVIRLSGRGPRYGLRRSRAAACASPRAARARARRARSCSPIRGNPGWGLCASPTAPTPQFRTGVVGREAVKHSAAKSKSQNEVAVPPVRPARSVSTTARGRGRVTRVPCAGPRARPRGQHKPLYTFRPRSDTI